MRDIFTFSLIASTIRLATPLVLAALGGLFSERSGVIILFVAAESFFKWALGRRLPGNV